MNFGAVTYSDGCWRIDCEPHVRAKLKRVFPEVDRRVTEQIVLSDNDENCRDLLWFLERYPMTIDNRQRLQQGAADHVDQQNQIEELLEHRRPPDDFTLALPPRAYQATAASLARIKQGLLIADDVGLGKTVTGICPMAHSDHLPALVVTLTHLPSQWAAELKRFAPELDIHILKSGRPYDLVPKKSRKQASLFDEPRLPDVIITNYHKLNGWAEVLGGLVRYVVFDEVQELRRDESAKYAAARYIAKRAQLRIGLSATPIYNYGSEFFNVIDLLLPGALGTADEFLREWCGQDYQKIKDPKAFGEHLRREGIMIRRTRADVGRELPPVTKIPQVVEADQHALERIKGSAVELAKIILAAQQNHRGEKFMASEEFNVLMRQATGIAKAPYVAEFVRLLLQSEQRVVLYGWHREVYALWMEQLAEFNPRLYTGSESPKQKDEAKAAFTEGDCRLLIISLRAGAGLDGLQNVCRTVVFGELDWSPGVHEQCLSADTEILTPRGFLGVDDLNAGDEVAAFDVRDGSIHWVVSTNKTDRSLAHGETMFATRTEKTDVRVTGDHRMIVRRKTRTAAETGRSPWEFTTAKELVGESRRFIPISGRQTSNGVDLTDAELRLLGWYLTDGSFDGRCLTFYQAAHQPWNRDLIETLRACGMTYICRQRRNPSGTLMNCYYVQKGVQHRWSEQEIDDLKRLTEAETSPSIIASRLDRSCLAVQKMQRKVANDLRVLAPVKSRTERGWADLLPYLDKDLSPLLDDATREQLSHLLHGIKMGDGSKSKRLKNVIRVTNTNKVFLDRLQSLCVRRGFAATISERKSKTTANRSAYDIYIADASEANLPRRERPNAFAPVEAAVRERVWCMTNELGTLVTRRNGRIAIVGNCVGRVYRDGQAEPVMAYYLIAEDGSDPIISDVLGVKRGQIEGVRDPDAELIERLEGDGGNMKRLAEEYLRRNGVAIECGPVPEIVL